MVCDANCQFRAAAATANLQVRLLERLGAAVREADCVSVVSLLASEHALAPRLPVKVCDVTNKRHANRQERAQNTAAGSRCTSTERRRFEASLKLERGALSTRKRGAAAFCAGAASVAR